MVNIVQLGRKEDFLSRDFGGDDAFADFSFSYVDQV